MQLQGIQKKILFKHFPALHLFAFYFNLQLIHIKHKLAPHLLKQQLVQFYNMAINFTKLFRQMHTLNVQNITLSAHLSAFFDELCITKFLMPCLTSVRRLF